MSSPIILFPFASSPLLLQLLNTLALVCVAISSFISLLTVYAVVFTPFGRSLFRRYAVSLCAISFWIHGCLLLEDELVPLPSLDILLGNLTGCLQIYLFAAGIALFYDTTLEFLVYDPIIGWYIPETE